MMIEFRVSNCDISLGVAPDFVIKTAFEHKRTFATLMGVRWDAVAGLDEIKVRLDAVLLENSILFQARHTATPLDVCQIHAQKLVQGLWHKSLGRTA